MNLIFNSVLSNQTSYGLTGINTAIALADAGANVMAVPIGGKADFFSFQNLKPLLDKGTFFERNSKCLRLYHQFGLNEHVGNGELTGWPIFETTLFTVEERHQLSNVDKLFVCSAWAKQIIEENNIITPTFVVPLGVDLKIFKPQIRDDDGIFRFFYPGKFEIRKSFDIVMDIFEEAFSVNDNIEIVFLPTNQFIGNQNDEWRNYLLSSKLASKIKIINRLSLPTEVANIYNQSDCIVSFSKAEGWGLPLLEGLACGKTVVATNYSGHTEFLNSENSLLVDVDGLEIAIDGVFFRGNVGNWGLIGKKCKSGLAEGLRQAYKNGKKINEAGIKTAKRFTWDNTAKSILKYLED